jgi:branched-subunit amino acid aminotransferase/4-amino-4-deoxychorismate lyase
MGTAMPEPLAYLNGEFLPQTEVRLPVHDSGFVFGATVTDLCRTFKHQAFRLGDHLERFRQGCRWARIRLQVRDAELVLIAEHLIRANSALLPAEQDLALVMFATPGPIGYYAGLAGGPDDGPPTLGMHTFPLPFARYHRFFEEGAHLIVPATRHVPGCSVDPRIKQRSRLHWWLAEQEAHLGEQGAVALLLDADDNVTETAGANFLAVRDGVVLSPPRESILGGISLRTVEELCLELGLSFEYRSLTLQDCLSANEAFLASTPYCLAGISRLNGVTVPWPGPILEKLLAAWGQRVGLDVQQQICSGR